MESLELLLLDVAPRVIYGLILTKYIASIVSNIQRVKDLQQWSEISF